MEALPMIGGDGPNSYAKNSSYQKEGASTVLAAVKEAILKDSDLGWLSPGQPFRIADLGCSVGPNTFDAVDAIIEAVKLKLGVNYDDDDAPPEFQVFFNDLPSNDFNTLLRSPRLMKGCNYFAAAAPGSCHGRLFPKSSLHFLLSFYTLHWLSRVPEAVEDENSPAWNKGKIFCDNDRVEVVEAYSAQFVADMEQFLLAREEELVPGSLMALVFPYGRLDQDNFRAQPVLNSLFFLLESTLKDMVAMGKVDEHEVDAFNFPLHLPSPEAVERAVERNGCFDVVEIKVFASSCRSPGVAFDAGVQSKQVRAITGEMMNKHFGEEIVEEIYERHRVKIEEKAQVLKEYMGGIKSLFILLKRKPN